jgi:CRISPR associated protein Cas1
MCLTEMAAGKAFAYSMPSFHKPILYLDDDGITLATYAGSLVFRSPRIELTAVPENAHTIVLSGYGGSITLNAIDVAAANRVEIILVRREQATALFAPILDSSRGSLALRAKQFAAVLDPTKTVAIARKIVSAKVKAEGNESGFLTALRTTKTTDDIRHVEAKAAQVFWRHWVDFKMRFAGNRTPAEWQSWSGRYIGRRQGRLGELEAQFTPRHAVHPMQARCGRCSDLWKGGRSGRLNFSQSKKVS